MIIIVLLCIAAVPVVWVCRSTTLSEGRLRGLAEADRRNLHQQRMDRQVGRIEAVRDCALWLTDHGQVQSAAELLHLAEKPYIRPEHIPPFP